MDHIMMYDYWRKRAEKKILWTKYRIEDNRNQTRREIKRKDLSFFFDEFGDWLNRLICSCLWWIEGIEFQTKSCRFLFKQIDHVLLPEIILRFASKIRSIIECSNTKKEEKRALKSSSLDGKELRPPTTRSNCGWILEKFVEK